jgi:pimeloyl-ACP methyl ester carboxylesterase
MAILHAAAKYQAACLSLLALLLSTSIARADDIAVTIATRPSVTQSFIANIQANPVAVVILFPGGNGVFTAQANPDGSLAIANKNFLIRSRQMFSAANIATVLVNTPSDRPSGFDEAFRKSPEHAQDVADVLDWITQHTSAPVWLVGTSMGTISAAANAVALQNKIAGVILTSSITVTSRYVPDGGVSTLNLAAISVPALVMDDTEDACGISPPGNASALAAHMSASPRAKSILIDGGDPPVSGPCGALSYHGYLGVETQAVSTMINFIEDK